MACGMENVGRGERCEFLGDPCVGLHRPKSRAGSSVSFESNRVIVERTGVDASCVGASVLQSRHTLIYSLWIWWLG